MCVPFASFHFFTVLQTPLKNGDQHVLYVMFNSNWTLVPYLSPTNRQPCSRYFPCALQAIYPGPMRGYNEVSVPKSIKQFASV